MYSNETDDVKDNVDIISKNFNIFFASKHLILYFSRKFCIQQKRCACIKHHLLIWLRRQRLSNAYSTLLLYTELIINNEKMIRGYKKNLLHTNTLSLTLKCTLYLKSSTMLHTFNSIWHLCIPPEDGCMLAKYVGVTYKVYIIYEVLSLNLSLKYVRLS